MVLSVSAKMEEKNHIYFWSSGNHATAFKFNIHLRLLGA